MLGGQGFLGVFSAQEANASSSSNGRSACGLLTLQQLHAAIGGRWHVSGGSTSDASALRSASIPGLSSSTPFFGSTCQWKAQPTPNMFGVPETFVGIYEYPNRLYKANAAKAVSIYTASMSSMTRSGFTFVTSVGDWAWTEFPPIGAFASGKGRSMLQVWELNTETLAAPTPYVRDPEALLATDALRHIP